MHMGFSPISRKEKITTCMVENMSRMEAAQTAEASPQEGTDFQEEALTSSTSICSPLTRFSDSSSAEETPSKTFSMMMTTFSVVD